VWLRFGLGLGLGLGLRRLGLSSRTLLAFARGLRFACTPCNILYFGSKKKDPKSTCLFGEEKLVRLSK
jgi:hypothetical protein